MSEAAARARVAASVTAEEVSWWVERLVEVPAPFGAEAPAAHHLASVARVRHPRLDWHLQEVGPDRANLLSATGDPWTPAVALYGHLDTTLTGDVDADLPLTGIDSSAGDLDLTSDGDLIGPGLAVSRGPAAAALSAYCAVAEHLVETGSAASAGIILAAGGTHHVAGDPGRPRLQPQSFGAGVKAALSAGFRPGGVINVKGQAPGVLYEEPGNGYLRVRLRGPAGPSVVLGGEGVIGAVPAALAGLWSWRRDFLQRPVIRPSQLAREMSVGALRAGDARKPDFSPATADLFVYVVVLDADEPDEVAASIHAAVAAAIDEQGHRGILVEVAPYAWEPSGHSDPTAPLVRVAREVWERRRGPGSADVVGWRGSTDGVVFRNAGIATVRVGPSIGAVADGRRDRTSAEALVAMARDYVDLIFGVLFYPSEGGLGGDT